VLNRRQRGLLGRKGGTFEGGFETNLGSKWGEGGNAQKRRRGEREWTAEKRRGEGAVVNRKKRGVLSRESIPPKRFASPEAGRYKDIGWLKSQKKKESGKGEYLKQQKRRRRIISFKNPDSRCAGSTPKKGLR